MDKSKLTELLRYAWLEGRTNGLQNNGKSFSEFLQLKEVSEAINYSQCCKSDSELLTSFAEYLKERDILTIKRENIPVRVDLFLKRG